MSRVNVPILILNIITLGGGLALVIIGALNLGVGCGLGYVFVGVGALLLLCPLACLYVTIRGRSDFAIFRDKPKGFE